MKQVISVILMLLLTANMISANVVSMIEENTHTNYIKEAEILKELGLFKGDNTGFNLERHGTRVEAAVIIVRLLGMEEEALKFNYNHPFTDIPNWADPYIGYLYESKLTLGVGNNLYGSERDLTPEQFMTFCLRSLSYDDKIGDFEWEKSIDKAVELNIIDSEFKTYLETNNNIYRDDIVAILYNLLNIMFKNNEISLIDFLIANEVMTLESTLNLGVYKQPMPINETIVINKIVIEKKAVIIDELYGVKHYLIVPFGEIEKNYISVVEGVTNNGVTYQVAITKEMFYSNEIFAQLIIGQDFTFAGNLAVNILPEEKNIRFVMITQN